MIKNRENSENLKHDHTTRHVNIAKQGHAMLWERRGMRKGNKEPHVAIQARSCGVSKRGEACDEGTWHVMLLVKAMRCIGQGMRQGTVACRQGT